MHTNEKNINQIINRFRGKKISNKLILSIYHCVLLVTVAQKVESVSAKKIDFSANIISSLVNSLKGLRYTLIARPDYIPYFEMMYSFLQANKPQYNFTQRFGLEITRISKYEWSLAHDFDDNVGFLIKKDIQPFSNMNQTSFEYLAHKLIYCDKFEYNFIADFIVTKEEEKISVAHAATYAFMYMSDDVFRLVMLHMLFFQDIFFDVETQDLMTDNLSIEDEFALTFVY